MSKDVQKKTDLRFDQQMTSELVSVDNQFASGVFVQIFKD